MDNYDDEPIERSDTLYRIIRTVVLAIALEVAGTVLLALVVFSHGYALITQHGPPEPVRRFSDRASALVYRIYRYMTYNEGDPPFPFDDFPEPIEPRRESAAIDEQVAAELHSMEG